MEYKKLPNMGLFPAKQKKEIIKLNNIKTKFTIKDLLDYYVTERIFDRQVSNGKLIKRSRTPKGQNKVKSILYSDVIKKLGNRDTVDISKQDIINLILDIV